jgi:hypothetical protein
MACDLDGRLPFPAQQLLVQAVEQVLDGLLVMGSQRICGAEPCQPCLPPFGEEIVTA